MVLGRCRCVAIAMLICIIAALITVTKATYKKPPFNGSIFGKRANFADLEGATRALSSLCEIASEACIAWFPSSDNN